MERRGRLSTSSDASPLRLHRPHLYTVIAWRMTSPVSSRAHRQSPPPAGVARRPAGPRGGQPLRGGPSGGRDRAIAAAIAFQEDVGLESISDGEFRRQHYFGHFAAAVEGFERHEANSPSRRVRARRCTTRQIRHREGSAEAAGLRPGVRVRQGPHVADAQGDLAEPARDALLPLEGGRLGECLPASSTSSSPTSRGPIARRSPISRAWSELRPARRRRLPDPLRPAAAGRGERHGATTRTLSSTATSTHEQRARRTAGRPTIGMHLCRGTTRANGSAKAATTTSRSGSSVVSTSTPSFSSTTPQVGKLRTATLHAGRQARRARSRKLQDSGARIEGRRSCTASRRQPLRRRRRALPEPAVRLRERRGGQPGNPDDQRRKLELVVDVANAAWS